MSKGLTRIGDLLTGIIKPEMRPPSPVKQRLIDVPRTDEPDSTGSCKPVGVAAAANVGARNHKKEAHNAQQSLFDGMFELRENRLALTDNIVQIAQALIFCGMPYRPTTAREVCARAAPPTGRLSRLFSKRCSTMLRYLTAPTAPCFTGWSIKRSKQKIPSSAGSAPASSSSRWK